MSRNVSKGQTEELTRQVACVPLTEEYLESQYLKKRAKAKAKIPNSEQPAPFQGAILLESQGRSGEHTPPHETDTALKSSRHLYTLLSTDSTDASDGLRAVRTVNEIFWKGENPSSSMLIHTQMLS